MTGARNGTSQSYKFDVLYDVCMILYSKIKQFCCQFLPLKHFVDLVFKNGITFVVIFCLEISQIFEKDMGKKGGNHLPIFAVRWQHMFSVTSQ